MSDQPAAAAPQESIADRVAAQFGLTDEPIEPAEAAPEAPAIEEVETPDIEAQPTGDEVVEVEYDGERFQVPKKLEKAILQEKDYTQKSQAVAQHERNYAVLQEQAKAAILRQSFESSIAPELDQLKAYDAVLSQQPNWDGMNDSELIRTQLQRSQWKEQRDALASNLTQKYQQYTREQEKAIGDLRSKTLDAVSKSIPNWKPETLKEIQAHAKSDGYTDVELQSVETDPRHIRTLHKAMQYDKLMASKAAAVQTANKAPPLAKPGATRPMPQSVKNDFALAKAQKAATSSSDRAKIIEQRLAGRF